MDDVRARVNELVAANRILSNEGVIDAYGHVSVRHPTRADRFLLPRSRSPQLVTGDDVLEFELDGTAVATAPGAVYLERFIHAAIYEARPDVMAVAHAHTESVLPFTISRVPLQAVVQAASDLGPEVPVWDIRHRFGDRTNMLVTDMDRGRDLAEALGAGNVVLMRGHGFAAVGLGLPLLVRTAVYMAQDARVQAAAMAMGAYTPLSAGEIEAQRIGLGSDPDARPVMRAWEYFVERAGCADLIRR